MRVISWNMGCSYGSAYKQSNPRTWQQRMAWQPDIALIQETFIPSEDLLEPDSYVFTPYGWSSSIGTLVYARSGASTWSWPTADSWMCFPVKSHWPKSRTGPDPARGQHPR